MAIYFASRLYVTIGKRRKKCIIGLITQYNAISRKRILADFSGCSLCNQPDLMSFHTIWKATNVFPVPVAIVSSTLGHTSSAWWPLELPLPENKRLFIAYIDWTIRTKKRVAPFIGSVNGGSLSSILNHLLSMTPELCCHLIHNSSGVGNRSNPAWVCKKIIFNNPVTVCSKGKAQSKILRIVFWLLQSWLGCFGFCLGFNNRNGEGIGQSKKVVNFLCFTPSYTISPKNNTTGCILLVPNVIIAGDRASFSRGNLIVKQLGYSFIFAVVYYLFK